MDIPTNICDQTIYCTERKEILTLCAFTGICDTNKGVKTVFTTKKFDIYTDSLNTVFAVTIGVKQGCVPMPVYTDGEFRYKQENNIMNKDIVGDRFGVQKLKDFYKKGEAATSIERARHNQDRDMYVITFKILSRSLTAGISDLESNMDFKPQDSVNGDRVTVAAQIPLFSYITIDENAKVNKMETTCIDTKTLNNDRIIVETMGKKKVVKLLPKEGMIIMGRIQPPSGSAVFSSYVPGNKYDLPVDFVNTVRCEINFGYSLSDIGLNGYINEDNDEVVILTLDPACRKIGYSSNAFTVISSNTSKIKAVIHSQSYKSYKDNAFYSPEYYPGNIKDGYSLPTPLCEADSVSLERILQEKTKLLIRGMSFILLKTKAIVSENRRYREIIDSDQSDTNDSDDELDTLL